MEYQHNEYTKYITEQSLKAWLMGRLGVCSGYDELTRLEIETELRELLEDAA